MCDNNILYDLYKQLKEKIELHDEQLKIKQRRINILQEKLNNSTEALRVLIVELNNLNIDISKDFHFKNIVVEERKIHEKNSEFTNKN